MKIRVTDDFLRAMDPKNLKPAEPVFLVNMDFYTIVMRHRATLGVAKMQQMRFAQMVKFAENPKNRTVSA